MFEESPFTGACSMATIEVLAMLLGTLLLGLLLGYLIWGWTKRKLALAQQEIIGLNSEVATLNEAVVSAESITKREKAAAASAALLIIEQKGKLSDVRSQLNALSVHASALTILQNKDPKPVKKKTKRSVLPPIFAEGPFVQEDDLPSGIEKDAPDVEELNRAAKVMGKPVAFNDLTLIEGIGPRISEVLNRSGIASWESLSKTTKHILRVVLDEAGPEFRIHKPKTWPRQAQMASAGEWKKLKAYQDVLKGGV